MRTYDHRPDEAFLTKQLDRARRGQATIRATLAKRPVDTHYLGVATVGLLEIAQVHWGMGDPAEDVRALFVEAAEIISDAMDRDQPPDAVDIERCIAIAVLARRNELATVVSGVRAGDRGALGEAYLDGITALIADRSSDAAEAASRLTAALASPETSPVSAEAMGGLDALQAAVANSDDAALATAARERTSITARQYKRNTESRRNAHALLDFRAAALLQLAHGRGLRLPTDLNDSLAISLITPS